MATKATQHQPAKQATNRNADTYAKEVHSSGQWKHLRAIKRQKNPICEPCAQAGRTTVATSVHHIHPIETHPALAYTWSNLLSTCSTCHARMERQAQPKR